MQNTLNLCGLGPRGTNCKGPGQSAAKGAVLRRRWCGFTCAGMNLFLKNLQITFRRDPTNYRPRINKKNSTKDQEQKAAGSYYYLDD